MINYTEDQKNVHQGITNFQNQNIRLSALLNAPGGSGKTYTIANYSKEALYLTPTNQAKEVLKQNGIYNVFTISRFLKMEIGYTDDGKEVPLYNGYDVDILGNSKLIIIDECSMITSEQCNHLEQIPIHKLYCGDHCQLPPIETPEVDQSLVFKLDHFDKFKLTKNLRTSSPKLNEIINYYRNVVLDIKCIKPKDFNLIDKSSVIDLFQIDKNIRLVSYKNSTIDKWNLLIRQHLYPTNYPDHFILGEKCIVNKFISIPTLDNNGLCKYYVGDDFIIENIEVIDKIYKKDFCKCSKCIKYVPKKYTNVDSINVNITTFKITNNDNIFYYPIDKKNQDLLYNIFCNKKCIITNLKNKNWKDLYTWWNINNIPLIYPYATTIHKAQGSGFDTVIFDPECLYYNKISRQLKYVAVSRAKKELFIVKT